MAALKIVNEPSYVLELSAVELRTLQAIVGATSGQSMARAYGKEYDDLSEEETLSLSTLYGALDSL